MRTIPRILILALNIGTAHAQAMGQWRRAMHSLILAALLVMPGFARAQSLPSPQIATAPAGDSSNLAANTLWVSNAARHKLAASADYYVATTGSNANACTSSGAPCLTIQGALNKLAALDFNNQPVTVHVADGTYTTGISCNASWIGDQGFGPTITGNATTPTNVKLLAAVNTNAIQVSAGCVLTVNNMQIGSSGYGEDVTAYDNGRIFLSGIDFASAGGSHMDAFQGAQIIVNGNTTISGGGVDHYHAAQGGFIQDNNHTITISNSPTFTGQFAAVAGPGTLQMIGANYVNQYTVTGIQYLIHNNGFIDEGNVGCPANYFPGTVAGQVDPNTYGTCDYTQNVYFGSGNVPLTSLWQAAASYGGSSVRLVPNGGTGAEFDFTNNGQNAFVPGFIAGSTLSLNIGSTPVLQINSSNQAAFTSYLAVNGAYPVTPFQVLTASGNVLRFTGSGNSEMDAVDVAETTYKPMVFGASQYSINVGVTPAIGISSAGLVSHPTGITVPFATPASSTAACTQGQIEFDDSYIYTCFATNTWRRAALSAY